MKCSHSPSLIRGSRGRRTRSAFTLVELLIVVSILGILAALVVPRFTSASEQARTTGVERQLQTLRGQIELYRANENAYPPDLVSGTGWDDLIGGRYLQAEPRNPLRGNASTVSAGATINVGDAIPNGAAWYFDTTRNIIYASDASGDRYDF